MSEGAASYTGIDPRVFRHRWQRYLGHFRQKDAVCCVFIAKLQPAQGSLIALIFGSSGFLGFSVLVLNRQEFTHFAESDPTNTLVAGIFINISLPVCFAKICK